MSRVTPHPPVAGTAAPLPQSGSQHSIDVMPIRCLVVGVGLAAPLLLASPARAQDAERPPTSDPPANHCFGFEFGAWSPPLDARRAGHSPPPAGTSMPVTPEGRDWAITGTGASLVLFPAWWPGGVSVRFPHGAPTPGDTVQGEAHAFVADGRAVVPSAPVRAWAVPCARTGGERTPAP